MHVHDCEMGFAFFSPLVQLARYLQESNSHNKVVVARCPASLYLRYKAIKP